MKLFLVMILLGALLLSGCGSSRDKNTKTVSSKGQNQELQSAQKILLKNKDADKTAIELYKGANTDDLVVVIFPSLEGTGTPDKTVLGYMMRNNGRFAHYGIYYDETRSLVCSGAKDGKKYTYSCLYKPQKGQSKTIEGSLED